MDLLSHALKSVQFKGTVYCQADFSAPWGVHWEGRPGCGGFFIVVRGGCLLESENQPALSVGPGDLVMSPTSSRYVLRDAFSSPITRFDDVLAVNNYELEDGNVPPLSHQIISHGGTGPVTKLVMGWFQFDTSSSNPFLRSLPDFIHLCAEDLQSEPWLDMSLRFLSSECAGQKPGAEIAIGRLTDLIFIQAVRVFVAREMLRPNSSGWLKAMADKQIGLALSLVHEKPDAPWTVSLLAKAVNMSRSSFAARFTSLMDFTPLDYVTAVRMSAAEKLLAEGAKISHVADTVGYKSEAAFAKAFKRFTGKSPGSVRSRH